MITKERLIEVLEYRDGGLYWKERKRGRTFGALAGTIAVRGYRKIGIDMEVYPAHRLIFLYHHGYLPNFVDHADGDTGNNAIENLRECSPSQNGFNSKLSKANTSGVKGVTWEKSRNKWRAQMCIRGKRIYLGLYRHLIVAEVVIKQERERLQGEFHRHE